MGQCSTWLDCFPQTGVFQCSLETVEVIHVFSKESPWAQRYAWNFFLWSTSTVFCAHGRNIFYGKWTRQETKRSVFLLIESTQLLPEPLCILLLLSMCVSVCITFSFIAADSRRCFHGTKERRAKASKQQTLLKTRKWMMMTFAV